MYFEDTRKYMLKMPYDGDLRDYHYYLAGTLVREDKANGNLIISMPSTFNIHLKSHGKEDLDIDVTVLAAQLAGKTRESFMPKTNYDKNPRQIQAERAARSADGAV